MYLAYSTASWSSKNVKIFIVQRYLRLAPAMWAACFAATVVYFLTNGVPIASLKILALNLSLTFGFYSPSSYITVGGWSIGNEMVFYAVFPVLMILATHRKMILVTALTTSALLYFAIPALMMLDCTGVDNCWNTYILPANQIFLFIAGIFLAWICKTSKPGNTTLAAIAFFGVVLFVVYPESGQLMDVTKGTTRGALTLACLCLCYAALNTTTNIRKAPAAILLFFGDISYTLYMFHGFFADFTLFIANRSGITTPDGRMFSLILMTPILVATSWVFHKYLELKIMAFGKKRSIVTQSPAVI